MTEFSIYQINMDRDTANVCFIGMESLEKIKGTKEVNAAAYDRVYDGKMDCISLENIYQKFNVDHPADYRGRSLSVSDVVEIRESDTLNPGFYFVDSIGFKSISFDKSLCKEPVEAGGGKISVLLVEPNKYPKMIEIDDTLEAMQGVVGGDIEEYMPFEDEVAIICNEEGKVNGLTPNRAVYGEPQAVEMTFAEMRSRFNIICPRWDTPLAPIPSGSIGQLGARAMNARSACTGLVRNTPKSALHSGSLKTVTTSTSSRFSLKPTDRSNTGSEHGATELEKSAVCMGCISTTVTGSAICRSTRQDNRITHESTTFSKKI